MEDGPTNVTVDDWCGLQDLLGAWEQVIPIFNRKSEHDDKTDNEDSGESCPDDSGNFPLRLRSQIVQVIATASLSTKERALFAWGSRSLLCVASGHGIGRGLNQGRRTKVPRLDRHSVQKLARILPVNTHKPRFGQPSSLPLIAPPSSWRLLPTTPVYPLPQSWLLALPPPHGRCPLARRLTGSRRNSAVLATT